MAKEKSYGICPYLIFDKKVFIFMNKTSKNSTLNFFKGKMEDSDFSVEDTAIREFYEETGVKVNPKDLEEFFFQKNKKKDVGIFLVNWINQSLEFKFDRKEIFSAEIIDLFETDCENVSKNQRKIFKEIKEYFKKGLKNGKN